MKWLAYSFAMVFGVGILALSVVRTAEKVAYSFVMTSAERGAMPQEVVDWHQWQEPGGIGYILNAGQDRLRLWAAETPEQEVSLQLAYAAERIQAAEEQMQEGRVDMAIKTATKAQRYLMSAQSKLQQHQEQEELLARSNPQLQQSLRELRLLLEQLQAFASSTEKGVLSGLMAELDVVALQIAQVE